MSHFWLMQSEYFKSERHYLSLKSSKEQQIHSAHFRKKSSPQQWHQWFIIYHLLFWFWISLFFVTINVNIYLFIYSVYYIEALQ